MCVSLRVSYWASELVNDSRKISSSFFFLQKEAIHWAWELLTEVYKVPKERMYVTYFEGTADVPCDDEVKQIWLDMG